MNTDTIQKLLKEGKTEEAKKIITDFFRQDWSDETKGEVITDLAQAYIKVKNQILENQIESLKQITEALALIDKEEKTSREKNRLDEIRNDLKINT